MPDLWLGAEYNANYKDIETTDALMKKYLDSGSINKNNSFFERLEAQVSIFGNPKDFYYDDVSRVKATGKHTEKSQFEASVKESIEHHVQLYNDLKPNLILIGGSLAFDAYCNFILPKLSFDNLILVKLRNPSPQAHRGNQEEWNCKYKNFTADLSHYEGLSLLHLKCSNIDSELELQELRESKYLY